MQTLLSAEARKHIANAMKCTSSVNRLMTSLSDRIKKCTADFFASKSAGKLLPLNADTQTVNMFYWQRQGRKVLPESLELSIGVLGYTLEYAARAIYLKLGLGDTDPIDCPPMPGWYIPVAIEKIMVEKGHCLLSINRFSSCLRLIGACLACTVDHASQRNDHKECNEKQCSADNIKPKITFESIAMMAVVALKYWMLMPGLLCFELLTQAGFLWFVCRRSTLKNPRSLHSKSAILGT
jgi:hypothetical protein